MFKRVHIQLLLIVFGSLFFVWSCDSPTNNQSLLNTPGEIQPYAITDVAGNNLSFPVVWAPETTQLTLRGDAWDTTKISDNAADYFIADGINWYYQNNDNNEWQAETKEATSSVQVDTVDWGDNLEARPWSLGDQLRVEIVIYNILNEPLHAYAMKQYTGQQLGFTYQYQINQPLQAPNGTTEIWGADLEHPGSSDVATIYSSAVRLVIQKILNEGETQTWNSDYNFWEGGFALPLLNAQTGENNFSAEVNVQGKVIYGYNWTTPADDTPGYYRITFVGGTDISIINGTTKIKVPTETEEATIINAMAKKAEPSQGGGVAVIDGENNLTYIDVYLGPRTGKGSPGQGGHGGNSGGHKGGNNGNGQGPNH